MAASQDLLNYVHGHLQAGTSVTDIQVKLLGAGWAKADVDEAVRKMVDVTAILPQGVASNSGVAPMDERPATARETASYLMPGTALLLREALALFSANTTTLAWFSFAIATVTGTIHALYPKLSALDAAIAGFDPVYWSLSLLRFVLYTWYGAAALRRMFRPNDAGDIQSVLNESVRYVFPLLVVGLFQTLVAVGSAPTVVGPVMVGILLTFLPALVVDEGVRGMQAVVAARELVRGRWWVVIGYLLSFAAVMLVPTLAALGIAAATGAAAGMNAITGFMSAGALSIFALYTMAFQAALYMHVKVARGPVNPFPRPGQMKWYWLLALLGLAILAALVRSYVQRAA